MEISGRAAVFSQSVQEQIQQLGWRKLIGTSRLWFVNFMEPLPGGPCEAGGDFLWDAAISPPFTNLKACMAATSRHGDSQNILQHPFWRSFLHAAPRTLDDHPTASLVAGCVFKDRWVLGGLSLGRVASGSNTAWPRLLCHRVPEAGPWMFFSICLVWLDGSRFLVLWEKTQLLVSCWLINRGYRKFRALSFIPCCSGMTASLAS